ncbi:glycosyltransferase family 2 protein [Paenibacillus sp. S-38]|uniref:glycosyltransferase family 2 protein n=1 Tax=Paenibacillus sp. S-38 TaxID=3416710 RepID=UPI003CFA90E2
MKDAGKSDLLTTIANLEVKIKSYEQQILQLEQEKQNSLSLIKNQNNLIDDLNNQLEIIYQSNGWRFLSKYYRVRDSLRAPRLFKRTSKSKSKEMNINNDLVSIIIPVYNNSKFLRQCFDSALNQNYENIEVVVVDDCSTENEVQAIINEYSTNKRFKAFKNNINSGISATMNNAIIKAEGNWIAFLDCDDWLEPDAVSKLMNVIHEKNAVYGYTDRINEFENSNSRKIESFAVRPTQNYFNELLVGMYTTHLKIIKKDVFLKIGLHESRFDGAQDYDIALKTAFHFGDAFAYLPEAVYHHRIHDKQTTQEAAIRIEKIVATIKNEAKLRNQIRKGQSDKLVSFVILSFEKKDMTLQCVESIMNSVKVPYEIIIFDNASSQETQEFIREKVEPLPKVTVFYSDSNLGCPGGRRKATTFAKGDYIINLDNDILVTEGWIEELLVTAEKEPNIGAVCCKTVFPNGEIQFNGGTYSITNNDFITFLLTDNSKREEDVETALWHECGWVPGGATLFKRIVVDRLDYSEGYINAFEDNDIAIQIKNLGYKMLNCPSSKVYHYHIMHNKEQINKEKDYMRVRYNNEGFVKSLLNFYKRNALIINDPFVHRLMNAEGLSKSEIKNRVKKLIADGIE